MVRKIKFGVGIPNCREGLYYPPGFASPGEIVEAGVMAEDLGYDSVWVNDHYTAPRYVKEMWKDPPNFYEPMITLTAVACRTRRISLAAAVMVLPIREPVVLAKTATTLDVLSGERLILGVGLGSYREEFAAVCSSRKESERPGLLDDRLAALRALTMEKSASFRGRYTNFQDVEMFPRPTRALPIYVGGNSEKGLDRVAKFGDGWIPTGLGAQEIGDRLRLLKQKVRDTKRDQSKIEVAPQFTVCIGSSPDEAFRIYKNSALFKHIVSLKDSTFRGHQVEDSASKNLVGSVDDVIEKIGDFTKVGVQHFAALLFVAKSFSEYKRNVKLFAREVLPSF